MLMLHEQISLFTFNVQILEQYRTNIATYSFYLHKGMNDTQFRTMQKGSRYIPLVRFNMLWNLLAMEHDICIFDAR